MLSCFYKNNAFGIHINYQEPISPPPYTIFKLFKVTEEDDITFIILFIENAINKSYTYNMYEGHASDIH